jgi:hypothetical protein
LPRVCRNEPSQLAGRVERRHRRASGQPASTPGRAIPREGQRCHHLPGEAQRVRFVNRVMISHSGRLAVNVGAPEVLGAHLLGVVAWGARCGRVYRSGRRYKFSEAQPTGQGGGRGLHTTRNTKVHKRRE